MKKVIFNIEENKFISYEKISKDFFDEFINNIEDITNIKKNLRIEIENI